MTAWALGESSTIKQSFTANAYTDMNFQTMLMFILPQIIPTAQNPLLSAGVNGAEKPPFKILCK